MASTWNQAYNQFVTVDGTLFVYRELGPTGGTPVVFLHYFTAVLDAWAFDGEFGHPDLLMFVDPTSFDLIAVFDAYDFVDQISPRPLLMIAGSDTDTLPQSQNAIEKAKEPKELFIIDGASHIDLYDKAQFVDPAAAKLAPFFKDNPAKS